MTFLPDHQLSMFNLFYYPLVYGVVSLIVMSKLTKDKKKRILMFPKASKMPLGSYLSFLLSKALIAYTVLIPIKSFNLSFYIGTALYAIGLATSVYAMYYFSKADLSKPVTGGIYKISRHPMQVMSFIMWFGISIVSQTYIMLFLTLLYIAVSYPSLIAQEQFCLDKYGDSYKEYMSGVPRLLIML